MLPSSSPRELSRGRQRWYALAALPLASAACTSEQTNTWYFAAAQIPARDFVNRSSPPVVVPPLPKPGDPPSTRPALATEKISNAPAVHLKFYRVKIHGWSINGKADLVTGLYKADALHELFSEITPPDKDADKDDDKNTATATTTPPGTPPGHMHPGDPSSADTASVKTAMPSAGDTALFACDAELGKLKLIPPNSRFTVLYGFNAQAMADQVKAFATADETGNQLASLLLATNGGAQQKLAADQATLTANDLASSTKTVTDAIDKQKDALVADDANKARDALGTIAQATLAALKSGVKIKPDDPTWPTAAQAASNEMHIRFGVAK